MRGVERVGDLDGEVEQSWLRQRRPPPARACSVCPSSSSIDQEALALVLAEVVDRADVRMVQRRGGARFALEALDRAAASCVSRAGQELERDVPSEPQVLGAIDDAHPAAADLFETR